LHEPVAGPAAGEAVGEELQLGDQARAGVDGRVVAEDLAEPGLVLEQREGQADRDVVVARPLDDDAREALAAAVPRGDGDVVVVGRSVIAALAVRFGNSAVSSADPNPVIATRSAGPVRWPSTISRVIVAARVASAGMIAFAYGRRRAGSVSTSDSSTSLMAS
jgi:hypothetical protein